MLPARAARTVRVDSEVLLVDGNLDPVVVVGADVDGGEGRVAARRGVEGRDSDQAVGAAVRPPVTVGVLAFDIESGRLDPGLLPFLILHGSGAGPLPLRPSLAHSVEPLQ